MHPYNLYIVHFTYNILHQCEMTYRKGHFENAFDMGSIELFSFNTLQYANVVSYVNFKQKIVFSMLFMAFIFSRTFRVPHLIYMPMLLLELTRT